MTRSSLKKATDDQQGPGCLGRCFRMHARDDQPRLDGISRVRFIVHDELELLRRELEQRVEAVEVDDSQQLEEGDAVSTRFPLSWTLFSSARSR
jgi:hypothetical protein